MEFNKRCISKEEFKKHKDSDVTYALYVRDNLKPNDYFRTFDGQIFKSINVSPIEGNKIYYANGYYTWADISAIVNFSDNPIDLIKAGDYVNGYKVYSGGENHFDYVITWDEERNYYIKIELPSVDIKSIVTKEQFNSVKYEVE